MRHLHVVVVALGLFWAAACSSTSNPSTTPQPARDAGRFSVSVEDGSGTYTPALDVVEAEDITTVTVRVENAADVSEAFLRVAYDAEHYTPAAVEFGDFLGDESQVITLAVTDIAGDVPLGVVQTALGGAQPQDGEGVIATLTFSNSAFAAGRSVSAFPKGAGNAVNDLAIVSQNGSDVTLRWTEKNKGDYDNNGVVSLADLSPLGKYLGVSVASSSDPAHMGLIDGDGNGQITVADLTPLGSNLGNHLTGYWIFRDAEGSDPVLYSERPTGVDPKVPVKYQETVTTDPGDKFTVRGVGTTQSELGMVSNEAAPAATEPGAPQPPTNVQVLSGPAIGNLKIKLTWTKSTSVDAADYQVWRKNFGAPESAFALIATIPATLSEYTDSTGLSDAEFDYRMKTIDSEATPLESDWSNVATGRPYVQTISPPVGLTAVAGGGPVSITLDWDAPADGTAERYTVYRKAPGETDFSYLADTPPTGVSDYVDSGLTEGETYEYRVTSRDAFLSIESAPSAPASSQPSGAVVLEVTVTTDKTTHHVSGSEPASNLAASSNIPGTTYAWSASIGSVTGSGANVTYKPSGSPSPQAVTITVTGTNGPQNAQATVKLILTGLTIKTHHSDRGGGGQLPIGGGTGKVPALTLTPFQYLAPLSVNPSKTITTYTGTLAQYTAGKVVMLDRWELWCGPCKAEFPDLDDYAEDYEPHGYIQVSLSNDSSPSYSCAQIANWFDSNGIDYCHQFFDDGADNGHNAFWDPGLGYDYYIPYNVLVDRDGYARKTGGQAFGWDKDIAELCGVPQI